MTRVCFVGAMLGRHQGFGHTQEMSLADHLQAEGYGVICTSAVRNRYLRLIDILATLIRNWRCVDVQCLGVYGGPSFVVEDMASLVGKLSRQRLVMVLHGGAMPEFMARYPAWSKRVLRRADVLIAPSPFLVRAAATHGFKADLIPNLIDLENYPYRHRRELQPRLLWMRSFHPLWNPEMALRVFRRVLDRLPHAVMVMAGQDKGFQAQTMGLARDLKLTDAVRFPGFLDRDAKATEGNTADIFLNTNRVDNMPVSVVEACAMGLPVVATKVGGIPDLLTDGDNALLVPDNDDEQMAEGVFRLLNDSALAGRLSANARRLAEQSAWVRVGPQWQRVFAPQGRHVASSVAGIA